MASLPYYSTQFATASGTEVVVTKPVSLAVGDLLIAQIGVNSSSTITPPTDWNLIRSTTSGVYRFSSYYKVATSGDVAATDFTFTFSIAATGTAAVSRFGYPGASPLDQNNGTAGTNQTVTGSGITPTEAGSLVLIFEYAVQNASRTFNNPTAAGSIGGRTEAYDTYDATSDILIAMTYGGSVGTTATGDITVSTDGSTTVIAYQIANFKQQAVTALSLTPVINVVTRLLPATALALIPVIATATAEHLGAGWANLAKNTASWINQPKS